MTGREGYGLQLFDGSGRRKYLSMEERVRFLLVCEKADTQTKLFCLVLAFTGCRISEALALTPERLDVGTKSIVFRTLKRRRQVFRAVPVPTRVIRDLVAFAEKLPADGLIWSWCRQTAWRRIKQVMDEASIQGLQASPKGLRHGFGIASAEKNIPAGLTQRWMGHARLETTAIYQQAVGQEERRFAQRLWEDYVTR